MNPLCTPNWKNIYCVTLTDSNGDMIERVFSVGKTQVRQTLTALARMHPHNGTIYISHTSLCFDGYLIQGGYITSITTDKVYGHDREELKELEGLNE